VRNTSPRTTGREKAMEEEERRKRLRRNIVLIQAMRSCKMMLFGITVNVTYFQALGVSMWGVSPHAPTQNPSTCPCALLSSVHGDAAGCMTGVHD
jgi:hypothetical protein